MMIELSPDTEAKLQKVLQSGRFETAEQFIKYSLRTFENEQTAPEDEAYTEHLRGLLAESEQAVKEGRVKAYTTDTHHELFEDIKRRGKERYEASEQTQ